MVQSMNITIGHTMQREMQSSRRVKANQPRLVALLPYKIGSQSAINLAAAMQKSLQTRVVRLFNDRPNVILARRGVRNLINWGNSYVDLDISLLRVLRIYNRFG